MLKQFYLNRDHISHIESIRLKSCELVKLIGNEIDITTEMYIDPDYSFTTPSEAIGVIEFEFLIKIREYLEEIVPKDGYLITRNEKKELFPIENFFKVNYDGTPTNSTEIGANLILMDCPDGITFMRIDGTQMVTSGIESKFRSFTLNWTTHGRLRDLGRY